MWRRHWYLEKLVWGCSSFGSAVEQIHATTHHSIPTPSLQHIPSFLDTDILIYPFHSSFPGWECTPSLSQGFLLLNPVWGRTLWSTLHVVGLTRGATAEIQPFTTQSQLVSHGSVEWNRLLQKSIAQSCFLGGDELPPGITFSSLLALKGAIGD